MVSKDNILMVYIYLLMTLVGYLTFGCVLWIYLSIDPDMQGVPFSIIFTWGYWLVKGEED